MSEDNGNNPFYQLFGNTDGENSTKSDKPPESGVAEKDQISEEINKISEDVFGITLQEENLSLSSGRIGQLIYIEGTPATFDIDTLKFSVFERILLTDPSKHLIKSKVVKLRNERTEAHVIQTHSILYLFECFKRLNNLIRSKTNNLPKETLENLTAYVVENVSTALRQPALFEMQNIYRQVITLYELEDTTEVTSFVNDLVQLMLNEDEGTLFDAFSPILNEVHLDFSRALVINFPRSHFILLSSFVSIPALAEVVVTYSMPANTERGLAYAETLFGVILNLSCLPKTVEGFIEYFESPLEAALNALDNNLWTAMGELCERFHSLIEQILRGSPNLRKKVLQWIGGCLDSNLPRGRISATTSLGLPGAVGCVSDGFSINLASVLLRLSQPFVKDQRKLLKIDPTYPAFKVDRTNKEAMDNAGVHCTTLHNETCLQPTESGEKKPLSTVSFSFITECFFLTHRALDLSVRVLLERTQQLYQEIGRLQRALNEARSQPREEIVETFRERMEMEMSRYLCMRCALLEPMMVRMLGQFEVATSVWLIQVILDPVTEERNCYTPIVHRQLTFPLPEYGPPILKCIPELVVESVAWYLKLVKSYSPQSLEEGGLALMEPLLSLLLVMMGSKRRASNPHLRAELAQSLECLLPRDQGQVPTLDPNPLGVFYRERLFIDHPHKTQIVVCLINVFVSIEMTGEGVAFEQKFNYRRPMYTVMDYLWNIEEHRDVFKQLARDAEINMEEVTPPLFLRFLNLLMNDAIFLLDEALSNMAQLRTLQTARDAGEWERLPLDERDRNEHIFRQIGMTARFDNILGQETIHTLEYMSSEIKSIFCHPMMVERITAMLNYFLYHLVGPNKKNLKVKDHEEYMFNPGAIVKDICGIYIHLGSSTEFCSAVSKDGRSYSPQLFTLASDVLVRVGGGMEMVMELQRVSEEVARLASIQQGDEELLSEAPEEFLDPIMSTLMTDPVILPSSRVNIDRSTIARHLLSDQTDPFNRSPLTMNMVKSNTELREKIETWIAERKRQASSSNKQ
ncbi:ubiquitin conjugation factor E4 A [Halyomorpha halys]|uniref:ubiquitin conjugation factor E4 A n=1 Tax=Halyomorpha halys TaxID=286706 RepID=UPI0006D4FA3A|nr:ubiquitin conjugation factor E4 A [Halyomorpha halys]